MFLSQLLAGRGERPPRADVDFSRAAASLEDWLPRRPPLDVLLERNVMPDPDRWTVLSTRLAAFVSAVLLPRAAAASRVDSRTPPEPGQAFVLPSTARAALAALIEEQPPTASARRPPAAAALLQAADAKRVALLASRARTAARLEALESQRASAAARAVHAIRPIIRAVHARDGDAHCGLPLPPPLTAAQDDLESATSSELSSSFATLETALSRLEAEWDGVQRLERRADLLDIYKAVIDTTDAAKTGLMSRNRHGCVLAVAECLWVLLANATRFGSTRLYECGIERTNFLIEQTEEMEAAELRIELDRFNWGLVTTKVDAEHDGAKLLGLLASLRVCGRLRRIVAALQRGVTWKPDRAERPSTTAALWESIRRAGRDGQSKDLAGDIFCERPVANFRQTSTSSRWSSAERPEWGLRLGLALLQRLVAAVRDLAARETEGVDESRRCRLSWAPEESEDGPSLSSLELHAPHTVREFESSLGHGLATELRSFVRHRLHMILEAADAEHAGTDDIIPDEESEVLLRRTLHELIAVHREWRDVDPASGASLFEDFAVNLPVATDQCGMLDLWLELDSRYSSAALERLRAAGALRQAESVTIRAGDDEEQAQTFKANVYIATVMEIVDAAMDRADVIPSTVALEAYIDHVIRPCLNRLREDLRLLWNSMNIGSDMATAAAMPLEAAAAAIFFLTRKFPHKALITQEIDRLRDLLGQMRRCLTSHFKERTEAALHRAHQKPLPLEADILPDLAGLQGAVCAENFFVVASGLGAWMSQRLLDLLMSRISFFRSDAEMRTFTDNAEGLLAAFAATLRCPGAVPAATETQLRDAVVLLRLSLSSALDLNRKLRASVEAGRPQGSFLATALGGRHEVDTTHRHPILSEFGLQVSSAVAVRVLRKRADCHLDFQAPPGAPRHWPKQASPV